MVEFLKKNFNENYVDIWPESFEIRNEFFKLEKECARFIQKCSRDGIFVLGVNPTGKGKMKRVSYLLSKDKGVEIFFIIDTDKEKVLEFIDTYIEQFDELREGIIYKLLNSAALIKRENGKKNLNIPCKQYILFQGVNYSKLKMREKKKLSEHKDSILFKNFTSLDGENIINKHNDNINMSSEQFNAAIERLSPEYAIVMNETQTYKVNNENVYKDIPDIELDITGDELENKIFALDKEQINLVNEIRYGHRLILANPGAGKSVILLAKAFKMSKIYENDRVLVTCYNNNLAESYCFRRDCSGIKNDDNLHILTFHKLVLKLLREKLQLILSINDFDKALDILEGALDRGLINIDFKAIFIDEVQIFEPRWLDICYKLLKKDSDNIFLIAGDLNQDVKSRCKKGKAVWQQMNTIPSDFKGRVKYIRKNYRNTIDICSYVNMQLSFMAEKMNEMNIVLTNEFDINTHGTSNKSGGKIDISVIDKVCLKSKIKEKIKQIHDEDKIDYSDIAIVIPCKQHASFRYYPLTWIKQALEEEGIEFRVICNDSYCKKKYGQGTGVIISTIDSALGLDFKAVLLTALYPLAYVFDGKKQKLIKSWNMLKESNDEIKENYFMNLRKIYTASSRAREYLYILSDLSRELPINDLINVRD